ncbi:hypothetical protein [Glaciibacter superstes]|uniref:hypothetical protein n=1 Tax=Glaciibacter superstes TaxID=501023 RepID=UPI0003B761C4|nr:hypothetical protein [Glaciibacter superstes]
MTDQVPTETPGPQYRVGIEHFDALDVEFSTGLVNVLNNTGLANTLVAGLLLLLPDPDVWRLTISGDVVASVNSIEQREGDNAYTLERGVGQVGARTINVPDGTYDIVIGAWSFMPAFEVSSPEELVEYMHRIGSHLVIHESGHVILHQRGEDSEAFQELAAGTGTEWAWRKHLAAHIDDFRIEKMTNRTAPSPASNVEGIGDTLVHMRNELTESNLLRLTDGEAATFRSSTAVNDLIRVMTYLTAELGAGATITKGMRPDPLPEGWNEYLEEVWDAWALNLDRLKPADEPMPVEEIAAVLTDLCRVVVLWSQNIIGYHFEMHDGGSWTANWYRATY